MMGILQVYGAAPKTRHDACRNIPDRLHPEPWNIQEPIEPREVDDEAPGTALLRDQKEAGEEERLAEKDSPNLAPGKKGRDHETNIRKLGRAAPQPVRRVECEGGWERNLSLNPLVMMSAATESSNEAQA